jgi:hypothetical protein
MEWRISEKDIGLFHYKLGLPPLVGKNGLLAEVKTSFFVQELQVFLAREKHNPVF